MPHHGQLFPDTLVYTGFKEAVALCVHRPPGRLDGGLHVHPEVHDVEDNLNQRHRLGGRARRAQGDKRLFITPAPAGRGLRRHSGTQGVGRALARRKLVGMSGLQREAREAVVQNDARSLRDETGTKGMKDAQDVGDGVPPIVHGGDVGGPARGLPRCRPARAIRVHARPQLIRLFPGQKLNERNVCKIGV